MKLSDMSLDDFGRLLASDAPAPGGGSTAALEGALGAGLIAMVAGLTVGKKKYAAHQELVEEVARQAEELRARLTAIVDEDTLAFQEVSAVFAMPRETDEEKAARADALEKALKGCVVPPLEVMERSLEALRLAERICGRSNQNAASDLGVAALSLKAAVQGAWLNLLINLGGIRDNDFSARCRRQGEGLLEQALPLADQVYQAVLGQI